MAYFDLSKLNLA